jgi:hypothetical protein
MEKPIGRPKVGEEFSGVSAINYLIPKTKKLSEAGAIKIESERIKNEKVRQLFIRRALYSIGDDRGRELTDEELAILDNYVHGKGPTPEELEKLEASVPESDFINL